MLFLQHIAHRIKNANNDDGKRIWLAIALLLLLFLLLLLLKFYDIFPLPLFALTHIYHALGVCVCARVLLAFVC